MNRHEEALKIFKQGTVIPANPLALNEERKFNEKGQRLLTNYYLYAGSGGIAAGVHTTQFEIRLPKYNLYEKVLQTAVEEIEKYEIQSNKTIVRVAGVCGYTRQAVSEAETAKKLGYDAVLLSPGGLDDLSEQEMIERTKRVAEIIPVIGFYLQTAVGGRVFSFEYWQQICEIKGVIGIKCASFNRYTTLDVMRAAAMSSRADELALYTGNDDNIVIDLMTKYQFKVNGNVYEKEFVGGLLGHWSVWTKKAVELFEMIKAEKKKDTISAELLTLAEQVTDANSVLFDTAHNFKGCITGLHEVLRRQGLMEGIWCLNEEETLSDGQAEEIDRIYRMYPHLNDDEFVKCHLEEWKLK
ncbi:MAG: dihydrodipicolinate synthase family protein [Lachnospiraceae bacterium]|jgi:dihydrodipicolinate synthase/N-acetylneuraminate lyase